MNGPYHGRKTHGLMHEKERKEKKGNYKKMYMGMSPSLLYGGDGDSGSGVSAHSLHVSSVTDNAPRLPT